MVKKAVETTTEENLVEKKETKAVKEAKAPAKKVKAEAPKTEVVIKKSKAAPKEEKTLAEGLEEVAQVVKVAERTTKQNNTDSKEYVPVRDSKGRSYATGKRKNAIARVWAFPGKGKIIVNGKEMQEYFARPVLQMVVMQPFGIANVEGLFDIMCTVSGGGLSGQAGAVKHGISKALTVYDPVYRPELKKAGFLTRDARIVERKKYGRAKARRSFQFSKR